MGEFSLQGKVFRTFAFLCIISLFGSSKALAAAGSEVIVIYNSRLADSKELAQYYANKRQVPTNQVIGLTLPTGDDISRAEYRNELEIPLLQAIQERNLWKTKPESETQNSTLVSPTEQSRVSSSKIRYAALCYGVPFRILPDPSVKESIPESIKAELRRNEAAVDSEIACLPLSSSHHKLTSFLRNSFYTTTNSASLDPTNGILLVTRLDGPGLLIARSLVDKALQAEHDGLWGLGYFDVRGVSDPAYKLGDDWIRGASEIVKRLGFETYVDDKPDTFPAGLPMNNIAFYMGWYDENVSGPFTLPKVDFMPGAFAYHLHSFSAARLRSPDRNWVGPLLAKGATISMGSVSEPYLTGTPDVAIFCARLIYAGFTFGEAAYACQSSLSWQTTVVGDPLFHPFGNNPDVFQRELQERNSPLLEWSFLRLLDVNLANGKSAQDIASYLETLELRKTSPVLTEKLANLYRALGKPSSAIFMYQQALKLSANSMQRLKIRLTLGDKLIAAARLEEAFQNYRDLLREWPEYADKVTVLRHLQELAQALGKTAEAAQYQEEINRQLIRSGHN